jgi:hypothetical protein
MNEMLNYETMHDPMMVRKEFFQRMKLHMSYSGLLVLGSLVLGTDWVHGYVSSAIH